MTSAIKALWISIVKEPGKIATYKSLSWQLQFLNHSGGKKDYGIYRVDGKIDPHLDYLTPLSWFKELLIAGMSRIDLYPFSFLAGYFLE